ncbi:tRNA adenosine(34) deaminase TadA [Brackiella oedipodis]|uniref:tRNA adenosine(34) deaminase TadA n=1 Tax=Brackiella oedipodis TaxID=124225 RepID=UPI00048D327A|nr:tRNA adenosine(34) deaminase TadA [Brackiella oedipodis]
MSDKSFSYVDHQHFMQLALAQAQLALAQGEVPVGAVIVNAQQEVVASGYNRTITDQDPSAHAEMVALRLAAQRLGNHRLNGLRLYVTLEPCTMCAGAILHSRIEHLIIAAPDPKTGACGGHYNVLANRALNPHCRVTMGVLQEPCQQLLQDFFRKKRSSL